MTKTTLNQAIEICTESLNHIFSAKGQSKRVESIELSNNYWIVTLGFLLLDDEIDYKIFKVNAETGIIESMQPLNLDAFLLKFIKQKRELSTE